jgi:hypothetical protein
MKSLVLGNAGDTFSGFRRSWKNGPPDFRGAVRTSYVLHCGEFYCLLRRPL